MREIGVDEALPGRKVGFLDGDVDIAAADIVDENVDGRPLGEGFRAKLLAGRWVGDIGCEGPDFSIAFAHFVGGSRKRVRIARDKHHIGAGFCGGKRNRAAEATAASRDKNTFAVEPELVEHRHIRGPLILHSLAARAFPDL